MAARKAKAGADVVAAGVADGDELRAGLVKAIGAGLAAVKPRSPVYAVALSLPLDASRMLPPRLSYATEAVAQHAVRTRVLDVPTKVWSPDTWLNLGVEPVKLRLPPPIAKLCTAANATMEPMVAPLLAGLVETPRRHASVRDLPLGALLHGIAADLRAAELRIPRSPGLVVYALDRFDMEPGDIARVVADAVGPDERLVLERRGLLAPRGTSPDDDTDALESAPREATARIAGLEALTAEERDDLEYAGFTEDDVEEGRRILRWLDAAPGVPLESLNAWMRERQAQLAARPLLGAQEPTGPAPDELPGSPEADRRAKLRFLRRWLDGWTETLRAHVGDPDARPRLGL